VAAVVVAMVVALLLAVSMAEQAHVAAHTEWLLTQVQQAEAAAEPAMAWADQMEPPQPAVM